ncbi:MAG: DUF1592 domain-containing protein, partial [Myxococcales bacterium]|nr:DUF1592 domain-containing protein [Myxococcales bacterium]
PPPSRRRSAATSGPGLAVVLALATAACSAGESAVDGDDATTVAAATAVDPTPTTSAGEDTGDDSGEDTGAPAKPFMPGPPVLPRLTQRQYLNSIEALLGPGLPVPPLEPDTNPYLFVTIGAASTTLSELGVQQYEEAAELFTGLVFADAARREALVGCAPAAPGDACVTDFIQRFGRRAYRRPLTADEQARWLVMATELADGDAWQGLRRAVQGMLQSPHFLYRVELGEPDPIDPTRLRYTGHEMASRLSFLLWNTTPDDLLLDAAANGDLLTEAGLRAETERLLADPRARTALRDFFAQFLDLGRLGGVTRDPVRYPLWSPTMIDSMRTEVTLLVEDLVYRQQGDIRSIFSTRRTFVNSELAALYGLEAPGATPITFVPVELPEDGPRAGILTLGAFLTMNAHDTENSPTARGKYVRTRVLCQDVPPPPPDIDLMLDPEQAEGKTLRERLEQHRSDPTCAGCHSFIDPPGFLFEHFNPIGAWQDLDNGFPIDSSGDLDGKPLADARGLADLLADDKRVGRCIVTQLYRHAIGRRDVSSEWPALDEVAADFAGEGYRFSELLRILVSSDVFRTVAEEDIDP